jgi:hypothetical protein
VIEQEVGCPNGAPFKVRRLCKIVVHVSPRVTSL